MLIWVLPSLLSGMIRAYAYDINRTHQIDGRTMNFWRLAFAVPFLLALSAFVPWPTDYKFYLVCACFGLATGIGDTYLWQLAAQNKSRISTMFGPLNSFGSFVLWLLGNQHRTPQNLFGQMRQKLRKYQFKMKLGLKDGQIIKITKIIKFQN